MAGELGRIYREARRGDLDVAKAGRLATILNTLRACLEAEQIERIEARLTEIEQQRGHAAAR